MYAYIYVWYGDLNQLTNLGVSGFESKNKISGI